MKRLRAALFLILFAFAVVLAFAKDYQFTAPRIFNARTYPAVDAHESERVALAADPYDMPDKAGTIFKKVDFLRAGFLPINLILTNDSGQPLELDHMEVTLITRSRNAKIAPAIPEDIYRRIGKQVMRDSQPPVSPTPRIHLPHHAKISVSKEQQAEVEQSMFTKSSVEAQATGSGFFFFDVDGIDHPLAGARLEVTGITAGGKELFFFEVPMEKYLGYKPGRP